MEAVACVAMEGTGDNRGQSGARDDGAAAAKACNRRQRIDDRPATGGPARRHALDGGIGSRRSSREFAPDPLPLPLLAGVLWAAYGVNRPEGGRTAPTAINAQEIDVFAALPTGAFLCDAAKNALTLVAATDVRQVTG